MASGISAVRALNLTKVPTYASPVAVFVGGTSGIGQGMVETFARMTQGKATIIIVGRNKAAAESIFASLRRADESVYEFVSCDAMLMRNVEAASKQILAKHSKINFLVLTVGALISAAEVTEEGINKKIALNYYARWKFIHELLPALKNAKSAREDAKVFSVLGAGMGGPIDLNDLGLKNATLRQGMTSIPTYNDLMVEEYAERNPDLTFIHSYPGTVKSNFISSAQPTLIRFLAPLLNLILTVVATSAADCGEYMWQAIFDHTDGAFRTGSSGQTLGKETYFGTEDGKKKLWDHTAALTNVSTAMSAS